MLKKNDFCSNFRAYEINVLEYGIKYAHYCFFKSILSI